jgi:hypothetical protein
MNRQLLATYRRLAGRRDMNEHSRDQHESDDESADCSLRVNAYQNAINDLCDAFGVTEDELRSELTSAATEV